MRGIYKYATAAVLAGLVAACGSPVIVKGQQPHPAVHACCAPGPTPFKHTTPLPKPSPAILPGWTRIVGPGSVNGNGELEQNIASAVYASSQGTVFHAQQLPALSAAHAIPAWTGGAMSGPSVYHGTVTARIDFPGKPGIWSSLWLVNGSTEVDIMEVYGNGWPPDATVHARQTNTGPWQLEGSHGAEPVTGWHTWTFTWTSTGMTFYKDGKKYFSVIPKQFPAWPFNDGQPMQLRLDVAVGGSGGGTVPASTTSADMYVQYVSISKG